MAHQMLKTRAAYYYALNHAQRLRAAQYQTNKRQRKVLELKSILDLIIRNDLHEDWESRLFDAANVFKMSGYCLEVVSDARYTNAAQNARLAQHCAIRLSAPAQRIGLHPRITLLPNKNNLTGSARRLLQLKLLVLAWSLCALSKNGA